MIFRVITKVSMRDDLEGSKRSALIFFIISGIFVFICIFLYFVLKRLEITKFFVLKTMNKQSISSQSSDNSQDTIELQKIDNHSLYTADLSEIQDDLHNHNELSSASSSNDLKSTESNFRKNAKNNSFQVYKKIKLNCWLIFLNFFVSPHYFDKHVLLKKKSFSTIKDHSFVVSWNNKRNQKWILSPEKLLGKKKNNLKRIEKRLTKKLVANYLDLHLLCRWRFGKRDFKDKLFGEN